MLPPRMPNGSACPNLHSVLSSSYTPKAMPLRGSLFADRVRTWFKTVPERSSTSMWPVFLPVRVAGVCSWFYCHDERPTKVRPLFCIPVLPAICAPRTVVSRALFAEHVVRTRFKASAVGLFICYKDISLLFGLFRPARVLQGRVLTTTATVQC